MALTDEQALDPFSAQHEPAVPFEPVIDPAGWNAQEMAESEAREGR